MCAPILKSKEHYLFCRPEPTLLMSSWPKYYFQVHKNTRLERRMWLPYPAREARSACTGRGMGLEINSMRTDRCLHLLGSAEGNGQLFACNSLGTEGKNFTLDGFIWGGGDFWGDLNKTLQQITFLYKMQQGSEKCSWNVEFSMSPSSAALKRLKPNINMDYGLEWQALLFSEGKGSGLKKRLAKHKNISISLSKCGHLHTFATNV